MNNQEQIQNLQLNKKLLQEIQEQTKNNQIEQQKLFDKSNLLSHQALKQILNYGKYVKKTQSDIFNFEKHISGSFNKVIKENKKLFHGFIKNISNSIVKNNVSSPLTSFIGQATKAILGFERGGIVKGEGSGSSDSILARISNGEFIVNAAATKKFRPILENINNHRYANGGIVGQNNKGQFLNDNDAQPINIKVEVINNSSNTITAQPQIKNTQNNSFDIKLVINQIDRELANKANRDQSLLMNFIDQSRSLKKRGV